MLIIFKFDTTIYIFLIYMFDGAIQAKPLHHDSCVYITLNSNDNISLSLTLIFHIAVNIIGINSDLKV